MPSDDRFADAVKPALEALLSDLQHTTEVLRRAHISDRRSQSRDDFGGDSYDLQRTMESQSNGNVSNYKRRASEGREYSKSPERIYENGPEPNQPVYSRRSSRPSVQSLLSQVEEPIQASRNPGIQESRNPGIQKSRNPGIEKSGIRNLDFPKFQNPSFKDFQQVCFKWSSLFFKSPSIFFALRASSLASRTFLRFQGHRYIYLSSAAPVCHPSLCVS
ncbi:hypothetical protein B9Z55_009365 [Caenorhabditis nigoni]|uniref:Uncharacterized protein n=1 Tax=Caenorhabditis nigoni TaxID=1611254 RepID=A0A2G5URU1_9PELO|nr:hypothetical protein B9Z55_009365 [Caenorhabditis nigoni]